MKSKFKPLPKKKELISLTDLHTPKGRKGYYRYVDDDPDSFVEKTAPVLVGATIEEINNRLLDISGVDPHGDPRLKAFWAGTLPEVKYWEDSNGKTHEFVGKKYRYRRTFITEGYAYINDEGNKVIVSKSGDVPAHKIYAPERRPVEYGELIWVIEMKYTAEELVKLGWFPDPDSERGRTFCIKNGQRYRKPLDPRGEYVPAIRIEEPEYDSVGDIVKNWYRDITLQDVEKIQSVINKSQSESNQAFADRVTARDNDIQRIQKERQAEEVQKIIRDAGDNLSKLPVGRQIFI